MGAYQQMGHHSQNLVTDPDLGSFTGVVGSPVNYPEAELVQHLAAARFRRGFDLVFDPQLYVPSSERGCLREWSYFPADVDTADLASDQWWEVLVREVCHAATRLKVDAVCSPAVLPRAFSDDYFARLVQTGNSLRDELSGTATRALQTVIVGLGELSAPSNASRIASIITQSKCEELYLVLAGDTPPRRELADPEALKGAMRLISHVQKSGMLVFVAFCSSDMVLWKAVGATHCGTGKFFNLRRFTRSRFEEPSEGGGQLAYWFEESLLAFLRSSDLARIRKAGLLSDASRSNPFGQQILASLDGSPGAAWTKESWRQFLYWFAAAERRIADGQLNVDDALKAADASWQRLDAAVPQIFMEERSNDGSWIRQWRRALAEYQFE